MPQRRPLLIPGLAAVLALSLSGCFSSGPSAGERRADAEGVIDSKAAPAENEVDGNLLRTVEFENGLQVDIYVLGYGESAKDSSPTSESNGESPFPAGSAEVAVALVLSNPTDEPIDVWRFRQVGSFEGAEYFATFSSDGQDATHLKLGYESEPYEQFENSDAPWLLEPGKSTYYADTILLEETGLLNDTLQLGTGERVEDFELQFELP